MCILAERSGIVEVHHLEMLGWLLFIWLLRVRLDIFLIFIFILKNFRIRQLKIACACFMIQKSDRGQQLRRNGGRAFIFVKLFQYLIRSYIAELLLWVLSFHTLSWRIFVGSCFGQILNLLGLMIILCEVNLLSYVLRVIVRVSISIKGLFTIHIVVMTCLV